MCQNKNLTARVHSIESFGAADGPGVRFIVFLQGCRMRCKYCHNPDTWDINGGEEMNADDLLEKAFRYKSYWKDTGGITVSGGEPLLHIDFLIDFFKKAKKQGVSTVIDTAGNPFTREEPFFSKFNELMNYTDLLLLDLKEINPERHKIITGFDNSNILDMARYLSDIKKPVWIRHVLVPQYSDFDEDLNELSYFIDTLQNVERVEVLPYHTLGVFKWENLGIPYGLTGINPPGRERVENAEKILRTSQYKK
ncbi:pyruvate formate-lyase-activating protein [Porcipelethomonas sp.]|uniref:pyruvate formate-lyase-activating protein n=1 Tax=Porcipelethomonas sp. TaxID=2981675 RepID=UPI003EF9F9B8